MSVLQAISGAMLPHIQRHSAIFWITPPSGELFAGSATCIGVRGRYFLATARHNIADLSSKHQVLVTPADGHFKREDYLSAEQFCLFEKPLADVAWIELDPAAAQAKGLEGLALEARMRELYRARQMGMEFDALIEASLVCDYRTGVRDELTGLAQRAHEISQQIEQLEGKRSWPTWNVYRTLLDDRIKRGAFANEHEVVRAAEFMAEIEDNLKTIPHPFFGVSIAPGSKWREEIERAMSTARVAVLLASADFLASDFVVSNELPVLLRRAEEEGATLIPVVGSACRYTKSQLAEFQAVNPPDMPLNSLPQDQQEAVLLGLAGAVEDALGKP